MNLEEIQNVVREAVSSGYRGRLLARGQARAAIWRDGKLPDEAPSFSPTLSNDLLNYGHSLLLFGIQIDEQEGDRELALSAFEYAGEALMSVVSKGDPEDPQRGFNRILAAAAFHLAGFSARAFSLLHGFLGNINLSRVERTLALLILRSLDKLDDELIRWHLDGTGSDEAILESLKGGLEINTAGEVPDENTADEAENVVESAVDTALSDQFFGGLSQFILALQTGDEGQFSASIEGLKTGLDAAGSLNYVSQWWCFRLTITLLNGLWNSSFHKVLPEFLDGSDSAWPVHRQLFIASLYRRDRSEIELWPSQIEAAERSVDSEDDLVVSLPTGAGKTRIAELCILRCLSENKRVVFVTPLRALSAQTEVTLKKTFGPFRKTISALYGSIGTSAFDEDTLKTRDIVVATPEKLDFALRNDPGILDDVGLVVLDEGHMIGPGEREIRYEVQIQKLLKRVDADRRRIVCLSAVLPDGEELDDFVGWLRRDKAGGAVSIDWRPTKIRFGEVLWNSSIGQARLDFRVGGESSFIPSFFGEKELTRGRRQLSFPKDKRGMIIATAWRLVEDDQSVLIYCPERRSVEPYAKEIVKLEKDGFLNSVFASGPEILAPALAIGREWFGEDHPILRCLSLGVGIHHGALPTPYRKEIERLLREGVLSIMVSSPTLAQGLNLTATAILMHSLYRNKDLIKASEFRNVIGRAGRAFVDHEGLVLFPIFDNHNRRKSQWNSLISEEKKHSLESGLCRHVASLLKKLGNALGVDDRQKLQEYVLNSTGAWNFSKIGGGQGNDHNIQKWEQEIAILDTAILSLLGDKDCDVDEIVTTLDEVLHSSLWQRLLNRINEDEKNLRNAALESRAKLIWHETTPAQRRGYFLAGVGLQSGKQLDQISSEANQLLVEANDAILIAGYEQAINAIVRLGEILFDIPQFVPDSLPDNWKDILRHWLLGKPLVDMDGGNHHDASRFVENGLIYKLSWAVEAVKVRAQANGDVLGDDAVTSDGLVAPAIETGTLNRSAALLMQAGFTPRLAAIKAVNETSATFLKSAEMRDWMNSDQVQNLGDRTDWPTPESHKMWQDFCKNYTLPAESVWKKQVGTLDARWLNPDDSPAAGNLVKLVASNGCILSSKMKKVGEIVGSISDLSEGLVTAKVAEDGQRIDVTYYGPEASQLTPA